MACQLGAPAGFPLLNARLHAPPRPWSAVGRWTMFVPEVPSSASLSLEVTRNNAKGKRPLDEVVLGIATLGLSTLRLIPSRAALLTPPLQGHARQGGFSAECRRVGRDSVEEAFARLPPCDESSLTCLATQARLLGPDDAGLLEKARAVVDVGAKEARRRRRLAVWRFRSFEVLSATRCPPVWNPRGADETCLHLELRNLRSAPSKLPRLVEGLDALGREVSVRVDGGELPPGAVARATVTVGLGPSVPAWPVVLRVSEDAWEHPVPSAFVEDDVAYDFRESAGCSHMYVSHGVQVRRLSAGGATGRLSAHFSDGASARLTLPPVPPSGLVTGVATAWSPSTCRVITAVSGAVAGPRYLLLP